MLKTILTVGWLSLTIFGCWGMALAYEVAEVANAATIAGMIAFKGTPPATRLFELKKGPEVCGKERALTKVEVKNGALKGAVIVLEGVTKGKPFEARSYRDQFPNEGEFRYEKGNELDLDVRLKNCNFGPFTGVLSAGQPVKFINQDPIKHTLHTYVLKGRKATILKTVHNQNIPPKTEIEQTLQVKKLKHGRVVALTCDRHDFMENWMYVVNTPYFSISDQDGSFAIDRVPPGEYELVVWHPVLGMNEQKVTVVANGKVNVNFEYLKK